MRHVFAVARVREPWNQTGLVAHVQFQSAGRTRISNFEEFGAQVDASHPNICYPSPKGVQVNSEKWSAAVEVNQKRR